MNFKDFEEQWKKETFMAAAFNEIEDFDSFLDDPETGIDDEAFDEYAEEIFALEFPTIY